MTEESIADEKLSRRQFVGTAAAGAAVLGASALIAPKLAGATVAASPLSTVLAKQAATVPRIAGPIPVPSSWDVAADVVVVGGGIAGLVTAVEASSKGVKVVLLEESNVLGGTSINHGGDFITWGLTDYQKSMGITYGPLDTRANFYNLLAYGREEVLNLDLVNLVIDNSLASAQWAESIGLTFSSQGNTNKLPFLVPRPWMNVCTNGGWGYAQVLANNCTKNGVNVVFNARAQQLFTNPATGEVLGVQALVGGDSIQSFQAARAVVLATGSFCWNAQMTEQYNALGVGANAYQVRQEDVGDGIKMGQAVGADLWGMEQSAIYPSVVKPGPTQVVPPRLPTTVPAPSFNTLSAGSSCPAIWVNKHGNRFTDESMASGMNGYLAANQEDGIAWAVFDSAAIATLGGKAVAAFFDTNIQDEVSAGYVVAANTIADLDTALGISPPGNLVTTVNNYNVGAATGSDPQFGKSAEVATIAAAPFYATKIAKTNLMSFGGLRTNVNAEVLDTAGNPIPRLYGVGRVTGGYMAKWYPTGGSTLPEMTTLGRIAGDNAAAETPWKS